MGPESYRPPGQSFSLLGLQSWSQQDQGKRTTETAVLDPSRFRRASHVPTSLSERPNMNVESSLLGTFLSAVVS